MSRTQDVACAKHYQCSPGELDAQYQGYHMVKGRLVKSLVFRLDFTFFDGQEVQLLIRVVAYIICIGVQWIKVFSWDAWKFLRCSGWFDWADSTWRYFKFPGGDSA
jgi:hypothetical protein